MSIWQSLWGSIRGGWKTVGPGGIVGDGAFASNDASVYEAVGAHRALNISTVLACLELRGETVGSLPCHLRDANKNMLTQHDLQGILHDSPNSVQTAPEFWSQGTALTDLYGNAYSIVSRRTRDRSVVALSPFMDTTQCEFKRDEKTGDYFYLVGGTEKYDPKDILHLKGFSLDGLMGISRLAAGRQILSAQLSADYAAAKAFKQGMKVGGFFEQDASKQGMQEPEAIKFKGKLDAYALAENAGKWMLLPPGITPKGGAEYKMSTGDLQLLESRHFGIEEICRLFNCPPQLIGHTDKASSWASSLENVNLFFLMYSLQPTLVRQEARISKTLLSNEDRARGISPKFNIGGLLRSDMKSQAAMFASALQNGYFNVNGVLDLLDRPGIGPEGDVYRVQMNMADPGLGLDDKKPAVAK